MYERFTNRARKVMQLANQEAQRFNHEYIGDEHILLGLIKEGFSASSGWLLPLSTANHLLVNLSVNLQTVCREVEKLVQSMPDMVTIGTLPQTPRATRVIKYAIEEACNLNHNYVGTEHILLGLLREQEGVAGHVLINLGLKLEEVREEVLNLLGEGKQKPQEAGENYPALNRFIEGYMSGRECATELLLEVREEAKQVLTEIERLQAVVHELEDMVSRVESKRNERGREIKRLKEQFPDRMKGCTIQFIECEKGHGRLTATNWIDHGCRTCEIERLRKIMGQAAETVKACRHTDTCKCCWCKMRKLFITEAVEAAGGEETGVRSNPIDWEDWRNLPEGLTWNAYVESRAEIERLRVRLTVRTNALSFLTAAIDPVESEETAEWELVDIGWRKKVDALHAEIERLRNRTHEIQERADARNAELHKAVVKHERLMAEAHRQLEAYRQGQGIDRESLMETATVAALLAEVERLREENRGLRDLAIDDYPSGGVGVSCLPGRHGGYEQGSRRFAGDDVWWWFPTREAAEDALALAVEESCSVAAEAAARKGE